MANTQPSTELDFDQIKTDIIAYIKSNPTFTDYNFEGSALNTLVDILAYNTHTNAYYANMLHSEGFMDTAQKRSSVVSRAKELGYVPKSASCATSYLDVTINGGAAHPTAFILYRGDTFTTSNEFGTFPFRVVDTSSSLVYGLDQSFSQLKVINGTNIKNFFTVNTTTNIRSIFTIPNKNIDITTLKVSVRDSISSIERTDFVLAKDVFDLKATSNVYFIQESFDGYYQIYFGENIVGKQPVNGNVVDVDYFITTEYDNANGCRYFKYENAMSGFTNIGIQTNQVSFGGSINESIASIKSNSLRSNIAQNRTVTVDDYETDLKTKYSFIKSVSIWGGEDNVPPMYGKVFVSIQPVSGYTLSDSVKRSIIVPELRRNSMMTIVPELMDPNYVSLEFTSTVKFNPSKSALTSHYVEELIKTGIRDYITEISYFNSDYLESKLISRLSTLNSGIVSISVSKNVGFRFSPFINTISTISKNINNRIVPGSIKSTRFNVRNGDSVTTVTIKEVPNKTTTTKNVNGSINSINTLGVYTPDDLLVREIGTVNLSTGEFVITFSIDSYTSSISSYRFIYLSCKLETNDISTKRNQILIMDNIGEDPSIGLKNNNHVITEIYGK